MPPKLSTEPSTLNRAGKADGGCVQALLEDLEEVKGECGAMKDTLQQLVPPSPAPSLPPASPRPRLTAR